MATEHTPGPWHANTVLDEQYNTDVTVREPIQGRIVATVRGGANARLISAAPDLLYVCERLHPLLLELVNDENDFIVYSKGGHGDRESLLDMLEAAIAKATG